MRIIGLMVALALGMSGYADEGERSRLELEEARRHLEEAAKELAEATRLRTAHPDRAFLGVLIAGQDEDGIVVAGVSPDGGAEGAGIKADDIIIEINGESLRGHDRPLKTLYAELEEATPGDSVQVVVVRDGETVPFEVVTSVSEPHVAIRSFSHHWTDDDDDHAFRFLHAPDVFMDGRRDGLRLVDIGEDLGDYFGVDAGVLVLNTSAGSELKPGDIVKRIDGADVASSREAHRLLGRRDAEVQVEVRRKNRKTTVTVPASPHPRRGKTVFIDPDGDENDPKERESRDER